MDMYQKRKMRKENQSNNKKSLESVSINWYIGTDSKITSNTYKTMILV